SPAGRRMSAPTAPPSQRQPFPHRVLFPPAQTRTIFVLMARKSSPPRSKAAKPELKPLDPFLADLLNPALNKGTAGPGGAAGFGEAPQARFVPEAGEPPRRAGKRPEMPSQAEAAPGGVSATVAALSALLESGNPLFKDGKLWTPHRPPRPEKSEGGIRFRMKSDFEPAGDQPNAIKELVGGVEAAERDQVLLGVTGSGKTFTMAKVIEETQRPALILAHNKTLAAQLYGEFKSFFPDNAVEYFVSYYDYYQPEAYVPRSDTYIEKE